MSDQLSEITIRPCTAWNEFEACAAMQEEVWGSDNPRKMPASMFALMNNTGGQVIGAFRRGTLVGMVVAFIGYRGGCVYLYSHMLAVSDGYRNNGIGRRLKLKQREEAMSRGIELIEWVFDPLQIKNAYLNISLLGAVVRRYTSNYYSTFLSPLDGGLPTDRMIAEWWLQSKRVQALLKTGQPPEYEIIKEIEVPSAVDTWKRTCATREQARALQQKNRMLLQDAFARGLAVVRYSVDESGSGAFQLGECRDCP